MNVTDLMNLTYRHDNQTVSSDDAGFQDMLLFRVCVCTPLSVWSVLTGIVNIITYYRMGLRDGVNQNFFILSAADALQGGITLTDSVWYILGLVAEIDSSLCMHGVLTAAYSFPMAVSIITTAVIAVVRCCCVAMPFSVQRTLTASKQLAAILVLSGAFTAVIIYTSMNIQLFPSNPDDSVFKSKSVSRIWDSARLTLVFASFAIIVISMIILICALKKSSRLPRGSDGDNSFTLSYIRSVRDRRIIKGIFLILALFMILMILFQAIPVASTFLVGQICTLSETEIIARFPAFFRTVAQQKEFERKYMGLYQKHDISWTPVDTTPSPQHEASFIAPTNATSPNYNNSLVTVVQLQNNRQYFPQEDCRQDPACSWCQCGLGKVYVSAVIEVNSACKVDMIELLGCCKCYNNN
ncbi:hypothetical protein EGW08_005501 [Elysia chlorotica]|uniref:G-protein coupled receptors family 1 profile domain-containing protein n=1 Tax=Elysia chlorotica TaxID=188477 RepID=A0A3S1HV65_ELYCH|nr:hypothetical protein EGW08_005501 [Elysia chlorotica]